MAARAEVENRLVLEFFLLKPIAEMNVAGAFINAQIPERIPEMHLAGFFFRHFIFPSFVFEPSCQTGGVPAAFIAADDRQRRLPGRIGLHQNAAAGGAFLEVEKSVEALRQARAHAHRDDC